MTERFNSSKFGIKSGNTLNERLGRWKEYKKESASILEEFEKTRKELNAYKFPEEKDSQQVKELTRRQNELYEKFMEIRKKHSAFPEAGITLW